MFNLSESLRQPFADWIARHHERKEADAIKMKERSQRFASLGEVIADDLQAVEQLGLNPGLEREFFLRQVQKHFIRRIYEENPNFLNFCRPYMGGGDEVSLRFPQKGGITETNPLTRIIGIAGRDIAYGVIADNKIDILLANIMPFVQTGPSDNRTFHLIAP